MECSESLNMICFSFSPFFSHVNGIDLRLLAAALWPGNGP